jgi:hypothetical protein
MTTRTQVINNGTNDLRTYIAYQGNVTPFDSSDQTITSSGLTTAAYTTFNGLTPSTAYDVWSQFVGTTATGTKRTITTLAPTVNFTVTTDSVRPVGALKRVYGKVIVPSGQTAQAGAKRAAGSDLNFTIALDATPLTTYNQGVNLVSFDFANVPSGISNRYRIYGFCSNGASVDSGSLLYTYIAPTDTVRPIVTLFDTTAVTSTSIDVVFQAFDSTGIAEFSLSVNGTVVAPHILGTQTTHTISSLGPDSLCILTLQAKNNIGLYTYPPAMLVVRTRPSIVSYPNASISSVPGTECFEDTASASGKWNLIDVHGTNFYPGASYEGDYANSGYVDIDTIHYISSTHCQVWLWFSYIDVATFTITNIGAQPSNAVQTQVIDCGTATGITSVAQTDRKMLKVYPNPVISNTTIEVGQPTQYVLYSLLGSQVQTGELRTGQNNVSLEKLPSGIYILSTATGLTTKIVKQ